MQLRKDNKDYVRHEDGVENFLADDSSSDENTDYIGGMFFRFVVLLNAGGCNDLFRLNDMICFRFLYSFECVHTVTHTHIYLTIIPNSV